MEALLNVKFFSSLSSRHKKTTPLSSEQRAALQWKSLRATNAIERLNGEFRRRVKTQGLLPSAQAVERLLFGLIISGQIHMRRIDGSRELKQVTLLKAARRG